ncbi:hypothetical protein [Melissospora conviva]|uniref:hypothetical protein n=1 Tax=Melissospora conviva TaxID=3388432 RepID=UPI003B78C0F3
MAGTDRRGDDADANRVRPFRFTTSMPALTGPASRWRDDVRRIEELGFDSVSVSDHLTGGWSMDPVVAMTVARPEAAKQRSSEPTRRHRP